MPDYRRAWYPGGAYFFTVNLPERRDNDLLTRHMDYLHFNPVKHGLAKTAADWPFSTFHRLVRKTFTRKTGPVVKNLFWSMMI